MTGMSRRRAGPAALIAALVLWGAGCASGGGDVNPASGSPWGAATSEMAVRSFLDAANVEDFGTMSKLFGTSDGPAVEKFGIEEVEPRMLVMSRLLKHEGYSMNRANLAMLGPDRVRYEVRLTGTRKGDVTVPVIAVPTKSGRWFVERLNLDALTAGI